LNGRRVAVVGDINLDIIAFHSTFPREGGEELADRAYVRHGGSGANIAHALSLLGADAVMVGCVGEDQIGRMLVAGLAEAGADTSNIQTTREDTTGVVYVVVTGNGERTMLAYRGANRHLRKDILREDALDDVAAIHISGYSFLEGAQRQTAFYILEHSGSRLRTMDVCMPLARQTTLLNHIAKQMDYVFINAEEFKNLSRNSGVESVSALASRWGCTVVLKKGSRGCEICTKDGEIIALAAEPVEPVDTTGAGDAFAAGFIHELLRGSSLRQCGLTAVRLGAQAARTIGGRLPRV